MEPLQRVRRTVQRFLTLKLEINQNKRGKKVVLRSRRGGQEQWSDDEEAHVEVTRFEAEGGTVEVRRGAGAEAGAPSRSVVARGPKEEGRRGR